MASSADKYYERLKGSDITGLTYPVKASTRIYKDSLVTLESGFAKPLVTTTNSYGMAKAQVDNSSGDNGDLNVEVYYPEINAKVSVTGVSITSVDQAVYASDDETFSLTAGSDKQVGNVAKWIIGTTCFVRFKVYQE